MSEAVRAQYEAYPYPARDPRDESKRLLTGSPSHLDELNHALLASRIDIGHRHDAVVTQHECDHLDGILFVDRLDDPRQLAYEEEFERWWAEQAEADGDYVDEEGSGDDDSEDEGRDLPELAKWGSRGLQPGYRSWVIAHGIRLFRES